jgi:hypothetical protein
MDLDTSWIDTYEKISSIQENYYREPMPSISLFFIYMNEMDEIIKVICEDETLLNSSIPTERILKIIEEKRHINGSLYKLVDLLQYVVDIEPENLQGFVGNHGGIGGYGSQWLKSIPYSSGDIKIPFSIFIFHDVNRLFFFFRLGGLKSCLKGDLRTTKKVRIADIPIDEKMKFKEYLRKSIRKKKVGGKSRTKRTETSHIGL